MLICNSNIRSFHNLGNRKLQEEVTMTLDKVGMVES
jgi:hypothetical protein